jgi:hypothetical protein
MNTMKKLISLTMAMALFSGQAYSQEFDDTSSAYYDSGAASNMSVLLPIGLAAGAVAVILLTNRHHHHHHSYSSSSSSSHY